VNAATDPLVAAPQGTITLAHGGGGRAMRELIERVLVPAFSVVGQLAADGAVELIQLDIDLQAPWE